MHANSLKNLELGRKPQGKKSISVTLSESNISWLKSKGKPSRILDLMVDLNREQKLVAIELLQRADREVERLQEHNKELREEIRKLKS